MKNVKDILNWINGKESMKFYVIHYSLNPSGEPEFIKAFESESESELIFMINEKADGNFSIGTNENMPFFAHYLEWKKTNENKITQSKKFELKQIYN